jgi:hypothetical protein
MEISKKYFTKLLIVGLIVGGMGLALKYNFSTHNVGATSIPSKAPVLYDNNGDLLGQITSGDGSSFYNTVLNRLVTQSNGQVSTNVGAIYFTSNNCTGTAALPQNTLPNPTLVLIKVAPGKYYVDDPHATLPPEQLGSYISNDGSCNLVTWTGLTSVDPVFPVTLPFPDPLSLPLSVASR